MSATTISEVALPADVSAFLKQQHAEAAFDKVCGLVRECYPDLRAMKFRLLDDPDTDDRVWLVLQINLPESLACTQRLRNRESDYHHRFVTELPLDLCPLFALHYQFAAEQP